MSLVTVEYPRSTSTDAAAMLASIVFLMIPSQVRQRFTVPVVPVTPFVEGASLGGMPLSERDDAQWSYGFEFPGITT